MLRQQNILIDRYIFNLPEQQLILMIEEKIGKIDDVSYNCFFITDVYIVTVIGLESCKTSKLALLHFIAMKRCNYMHCNMGLMLLNVVL